MFKKLAWSILFFPLFVIESTMVLADDGWLQWRGPDQQGVASEGNYPTKWDPNTNIVWETKLPGRGGSTPVVAGATAYVTSGIDKTNSLLAVSMDDGKVKWKVTVGKDRGMKHRKGSGSNPSAVIKDGLIYAYFRSGDLACVNSEGELIWEVNLQNKYEADALLWDLGTSPLVTASAVVIAVVQEGPSYLVALDPKSGDEIWKVDRDVDSPKESRDSYTTPLSVTIDGVDAIAVLGADHLTLSRADDGSTMGQLGGFNPDQITNFRSIASPVASGNLIVCPYARGETVTAVNMQKLVAGDGKDSVVWVRDDVGGDVPTPVIAGDQVIFVGGARKQKGTVTSLDLQTGKTLWSLQIKNKRVGFSSSPVVAGDYLYVLAEDGVTHVIGPLTSETPRLIGSNPLKDDQQFTKASAVPIDNSMLIRTNGFLYRIGS